MTGATDTLIWEESKLERETNTWHTISGKSLGKNMVMKINRYLGALYEIKPEYRGNEQGR
jgi:hypothetical protein